MVPGYFFGGASLLPVSEFRLGSQIVGGAAIEIQELLAGQFLDGDGRGMGHSG